MENVPAITQPGVSAPLRSRRILFGLGVSGFLLALPGGLLPLWEYHIRSEFGTAANYFLALAAGLAGGAGLALRLSGKVSVQRLLAVGCFAAGGALLILSLTPSGAGYVRQALALLLSGLAAGTVNTAVFESIASDYEANPAQITLRGGIYFGIGSTLAALLLAECLDSASPARLLALASFVPIAVGAWFCRERGLGGFMPCRPAPGQAQDLRTVLAVMFALLLFFQFANEWSLAGWLPVFLIDKLGLSPETGVLLSALYWFSLTCGRVVTARLLPRIRHGRLLAFSAFCALFGCTLLLAAATRFGVVVGILLTGAGFSAIYPLAAESIAARFSSYHPGYFNGIFTGAVLAGILAPFVLGHLAAEFGLTVVPMAAMLGSCAVFGLVLLLWLGRKVSGS